MNRNDALAYVGIMIVSFLLVADLFIHPGRSQTFDGHVHITTIAQFFLALQEGEFPISWANGFANFGHPLPMFAQQTTNYLGAIFQFITRNAVLSYNLVFFVGALLSNIFLYSFLRFYYRANISFIAVFLFNFAPYRIVNIYVRGALPEFFAATFVPLALIGIYQSVVKKRIFGLLLLIISISMLALSHPMMLVISSIVIVPFAIYCGWPVHRYWRRLLMLIASAMIGLLIAGYYLLPLTYNLQYLYYGQQDNKFRGGFQTIFTYFSEDWSYFTTSHPGPRTQTLTVGLIETAIVFIATVTFFVLLKKKKSPSTLIIPWLVGASIGILLLLNISDFLYQHLFFLNNIQYPWRNLAALMFIPPLCLAWLMGIQSNEKLLWFSVLLVIFLSTTRFSQLYGKNYMVYDLKEYNYTTSNLHTSNMNTIWSGPTNEYPARTSQYGIIDGEGSLIVQKVRNSEREYLSNSSQELYVVDYTYYFPGWKVYVDGVETAIQFQNPNYRGLITYNLPAGEHSVSIQYEDTKIVILGKITTVLGLSLLSILFGLMFKIKYIPGV